MLKNFAPLSVPLKIDRRTIVLAMAHFGACLTHAKSSLIVEYCYRSSEGQRQMWTLPITKNAKLYRSAKVASLGTGRRGKHHDLMEGIIRELKMLEEGSALEIPLSNVDGVELANLRSTVHRAATLQGFNIQTRADKKNLYVWIDRKPS
jgi:hypothetical protein